MGSGIVDHLFSFEDLVGIVDEWEADQKLMTIMLNIRTLC